MNAICEKLIELGVALPHQPLDLSGCFAAAGVSTNYIVAMTGRSGSTWLASALQGITGAGYPLEYFSEESFPEFVEAGGQRRLSDMFTDIVAAHKANATFGFKTDARRLQYLGEVIDLHATFHPAKTAWIDMRRLNIIKQAFSYARARASGRWHSFDTPAALPRPKVSAEDIWDNLSFILDEEYWLNSFYAQHNFAPVRIVYEEIFDSKRQLLARVLYAIDPHRTWPDLSAIDGTTQKLALAADDEEEYRFVINHIGLVSEIMAGRGKMTSQDLEECMKRRAARVM